MVSHGAVLPLFARATCPMLAQAGAMMRLALMIGGLAAVAVPLVCPDHVSFASNNPGSKLFEERELPRVGKQVMWPDHCMQGTHGAKFCDDLFRCDLSLVG